MSGSNLAEALDHFVVPVDNLTVAEEFYVAVFDGEITKRNGLNVRQRKRGAVPHTFIPIGGKRMGVYNCPQSRAALKHTEHKLLKKFGFDMNAIPFQ